MKRSGQFQLDCSVPYNNSALYYQQRALPSNSDGLPRTMASPVLFRADPPPPRPQTQGNIPYLEPRYSINNSRLLGEVLFTCELCLAVNSSLLYFILQNSGFPCFFFILTHYTYPPPLPSPYTPLTSILVYEGEYGRKTKPITRYWCVTDLLKAFFTVPI